MAWGTHGFFLMARTYSAGCAANESGWRVVRRCPHATGCQHARASMKPLVEPQIILGVGVEAGNPGNLFDMFFRPGCTVYDDGDGDDLGARCA